MYYICCICIWTACAGWTGLLKISPQTFDTVFFIYIYQLLKEHYLLIFLNSSFKMFIWCLVLRHGVRGCGGLVLSWYQCHHSKRHHCPHIQTPSAGQTLFWKPCRNRGNIITTPLKRKQMNSILVLLLIMGKQLVLILQLNIAAQETFRY